MDFRIQSVDAALAFYFTWFPRLSAPHSSMPSSLDEASTMQCGGGEPTQEWRRVVCADIAKCLDSLDEIERRLVEVSFGYVRGQQRVRWVDGEPVYVDDREDLVRRKPHREKKPGRRPEELSYSGVARYLKMFTPAGAPDHRRVGRLLACAYSKLHTVMLDRGVFLG